MSTVDYCSDCLAIKNWINVKVQNLTHEEIQRIRDRILRDIVNERLEKR